MAGRIKNLFSRKPNSKPIRGSELKGSSYESAVALKEPVRGTFPVAGNGPNILEEYTRGRALGGSKTKKRLSISSTAAAPFVPRTRADSYSNRPTTAPHSGLPSGHFDSYERTRSGFSMTSPPNFSRKPTPEPVQSPTIDQKQRLPSKLRLEAYAHSPERSPSVKQGASSLRASTASPESEYIRHPSAYVDLLEAASTINPSRNSSIFRTRASGRRDYGEDVADRNIADFGAVDLSSPQFSYLREIYARDKTSPSSRSGLGHRRDNSAWDHILGVDEEIIYTQPPAAGQNQGHSRDVSNQAAVRPMPGKRSSSLTSASITSYGTRPVDRPATAMPPTPFSMSDHKTDEDERMNATASPPPARSSERSRAAMSPPPASIASDRSQSAMSPPPMSVTSERSGSTMSSPPAKWNERPRATKSPSSGPTVNSHAFTVPGRRSSITSTKSYIPSRGPDMDSDGPNTVENPPRTRALSMGRRSASTEGARAVAVFTLSGSSKRSKEKGAVETYSPAPPLPIPSRFARQQTLPTPPMSPIPDLSPTTPSSKTKFPIEKAPQPAPRRRSRSQSITYTAFPPQQSTRHSRRDSRASITPSEGSITNTTTSRGTSPARNYRREGFIMDGSSNSNSTSYLSHISKMSNSDIGTRTNPVNDTTPADDFDLTTTSTTAVSAIHDRAVSTGTAKLKHERRTSQSTIRPGTAPSAPATSSISTPVPGMTNSSWTSSLSKVRQRSATTTSHRSNASSSSKRTVRPTPPPLDLTHQTNHSASTSHSYSRSQPRNRSRSTGRTSSISASTATAIAKSIVASMDRNQREYEQYQLQQQRHAQKQQAVRYQSSQSHPAGPVRKLAPLTKNFVDDVSDGGDDYASSPSTSSASAASGKEKELLFQEGPAGFAGMLPGISWEAAGVRSVLDKRI